MKLSVEERQAIAQTTASYLGGTGRLKAMTGAKNFSFGSNGEFSFRFQMCKEANHVEFKVNGLDLYDVKFLKIRGTTVKEVKIFNNLYADQLKETFEQFTGLYLTL